MPSKMNIFQGSLIKRRQLNVIYYLIQNPIFYVTTLYFYHHITNLKLFAQISQVKEKKKNPGIKYL